MRPPPYEEALNDRPLDRAEFDDWVRHTLARSRPGGQYRVPWWLPVSIAWRRQVRRDWEDIVRIHMGRVYELGRRQG
jgi:hypothetical protein